MIQLFDRAGQQIEIERTSMISFCDEGEVSIISISSQIIGMFQNSSNFCFVQYAANKNIPLNVKTFWLIEEFYNELLCKLYNFMHCYYQLHEIDSRKANTAFGF